VRKSWLAALAALLLALAVGMAVPAVRRWNHGRAVDELLRTDPFFRTVVTDTPSVRQPLRAAMVAAYTTGNRYERLRARYAEHLTILQQPEAPGVDRARVCQMTLDLFTDITQLPEPQAAGALRHLLGSTDAAAEHGDR
jgi:hypothetical protein